MGSEDLEQHFLLGNTQMIYDQAEEDEEEYDQHDIEDQPVDVNNPFEMLKSDPTLESEKKQKKQENYVSFNETAVGYGS